MNKIDTTKAVNETYEFISKEEAKHFQKWLRNKPNDYFAWYALKRDFEEKFGFREVWKKRK